MDCIGVLHIQVVIFLDFSINFCLLFLWQNFPEPVSGVRGEMLFQTEVFFFITCFNLFTREIKLEIFFFDNSFLNNCLVFYAHFNWFYIYNLQFLFTYIRWIYFLGFICVNVYLFCWNQNIKINFNTKFYESKKCITFLQAIRKCKTIIILK